MKYFKRLAVLVVATFPFILPLQTANALETYSEKDTQQFMDWCTGAKSASESTCSCTVKQLAQSLPATALTQFLASQGSFSVSSAAIATGAAVTQALVSCSKG
jgi:hypothetical protein